MKKEVNASYAGKGQLPRADALFLRKRQKINFFCFTFVNIRKTGLIGGRFRMSERIGDKHGRRQVPGA
jgi:hypothetical protein